MNDVYCFGHVSTGVILRLKDRFPAPDGYGEVVQTLENHAGEATGSALVLARLGASVTLEGNWIGDNPQCRRTLDFLVSRGIDCSGLLVKPGYPGVTEIVVSDGETRTVFGRYCDLLFTTRQWEDPDPAKIAAARIVCVDPAFGEATLFVARTARAHGRPLVTSDARADSELARLADVVAISGEMIAREYPAASRDAAARERLFAEYVARSAGLSRRAAEVRFRAATGRTLRGEIDHVRLERLRALLAESDTTIGACAEACGFAGQTHVGRIFRQRFGMTMGQWRQSVR